MKTKIPTINIARRLSPRIAAAILVPVALTVSARLCAQKSQEDRHQPEIIAFDAPGAATVASPVCAPFCGTFAYAVNEQRIIVGFYTDTNIVGHGFVRTRDGDFTSFDAPGAGLGHGLNEGTVAYSINNRGEIAGQFQDPNLVFHGFVRYPDGTIATFDVPGAGTGAGQGTLGEGINPAGEIDGYYLDANNVGHGFLRTPDGAITTFDAPGAGTGTFQGTYPLEKHINPKGEIDGYYVDQNNVGHGFLRTPDGAITTFDPPGSTFTIAGGINHAGAITGYYVDASGAVNGFLRAKDGAFTIFNAPGANLATLPFSLNPKQEITGTYLDANFVLHGFLRAKDGDFTTFDAPGAGTGFAQGTRPEFIDAGSQITGFYYDENNVGHGFLRTP
jgi:hypothetical protein